MGVNVLHLEFNPHTWTLQFYLGSVKVILGYLRHPFKVRRKLKPKKKGDQKFKLFFFGLATSASSSSVHHLMLGSEFGQFSSPSQVNKINQDSPKFRYNTPNKVVIS